MNQNLVIDIGNTRIKCALFQKDKMIDLRFFQKDDYHSCQEYLSILDAEWCILSTTQEDNSDFIDFLQSRFTTINFTSQTPLPISISYKTPETLGDDRKAAICGAISLFGVKPILVITVGTCITYNYFDGQSFVGGGISPGLRMRYRAMNEFTDLLPLVQDSPFDELVGTSTEESMLSGVRQGILEEVDGIISKYELLQKKIPVFLCGGDTIFFERRLKNEIFASPNLVLLGLNHILEYNKTA